MQAQRAYENKISSEEVGQDGSSFAGFVLVGKTNMEVLPTFWENLETAAAAAAAGFKILLMYVDGC